MEPANLPVSILLADFQFLTRIGLKALVDEMEGFSIAAHVETPSGVFEAMGKHKADLLIMDFKENDHSFRILEQIMALNSMQVLVVTNYLQPETLQQLLSMGVRAIVTKNCSEDEIKNAMVAAWKGKRFFCNRVLDWMVDQKIDTNNCDPASLTPRENEVLNLVVKGISTSQIAETLHLSIHTVNTHRKNILKKLRLRSPAELIVFALRNGLPKT